jgi:hypothetical protein
MSGATGGPPDSSKPRAGHRHFGSPAAPTRTRRPWWRGWPSRTTGTSAAGNPGWPPAVTSLLLLPPGSCAGQVVNAEAPLDVTSPRQDFYGRGFARVHWLDSVALLRVSRGRANTLKHPNRLNARSGSVAGPPPATPTSAATTGRAEASLRAAIAFSAEVSVSTIQSHADAASAPSASPRQWAPELSGERSTTRSSWTSRTMTCGGAGRDAQHHPDQTRAEVARTG